MARFVLLGLQSPSGALFLTTVPPVQSTESRCGLLGFLSLAHSHFTDSTNCTKIMSEFVTKRKNFDGRVPERVVRADAAAEIPWPSVPRMSMV